MPLQSFDPPASVTDLPDMLKSQWGAQINQWIEEERGNLPQPYSNYFFNELQHPESNGAAAASIVWEGFPRFWKIKFPNNDKQRWQASEKVYTSQEKQFRYQDEYLEWVSFRRDNKLEAV